MAARYGWMSDTGPEAFEAWIRLQRKMTPAEKLAQVFEMAAMLARACEGRIRREYPLAGEREVFLRGAALRLGRETVSRVYGWNPDSGGAP